MLSEIGDRSDQQGQQLLVPHRQPVLPHARREGLGIEMAAVGEEDERPPRSADGLDHLDRARQRHGAEVRVAVDEGAVDVEDEAPDVVELHRWAATSATIASTCSADIVSLSNSYSSGIPSPKRSRAPSRLSGWSLPSFSALAPERTLSFTSGSTGAAGS